MYLHLNLHDIMEKVQGKKELKKILFLFDQSAVWSLGKTSFFIQQEVICKPYGKYVRNEAAELKDLLRGKASKGFSIYALNFCQLNQRRMYSHLTFYMNSRKRDQTSEDSKSHFLFAEQSSFLLRLFAKILFYGHSTKYDFRSDRDGPTSLLSGS